jgi:choline dehydrogenase
VVARVKLARRVTARLRSWGASEFAPGESVQTDDELRQWIRDNAWEHHACGTCAMGPDDSGTAVVDGKFRVRGVPGLRVVDASVFPRIPGYFIVTPTYMISEKAADDIAAAAEATGPSSVEGWPLQPSVEPSEMRMS